MTAAETTETCADCDAPAAGGFYAGYRRIGDHWLPMLRPLCDYHAGEDARARAEARAS